VQNANDALRTAHTKEGDRVAAHDSVVHLRYGVTVRNFSDCINDPTAPHALTQQACTPFDFGWFLETIEHVQVEIDLHCTSFSYARTPPPCAVEAFLVLLG
jgi:hypothetical protein